LEKIDCGNNSIIIIPSLQKYNKLIELYCSHNRLEQLPQLPDSLEELYCDNNQITQLLSLPKYLKILMCNWNQITRLPPLQDLEVLSCRNNQLTRLPRLPNSLKELNCYYNQLTKLPSLSDLKNLKELYYDEETIPFPLIPYELDTLNDKDENCIANLKLQQHNHRLAHLGLDQVGEMPTKKEWENVFIMIKNDYNFKRSTLGLKKITTMPSSKRISRIESAWKYRPGAKEYQKAKNEFELLLSKQNLSLRDITNNIGWM
jgi:hypothetical protein